uniref:CxC2-like cysteine cluster KDZ transposase-associated domain-containing protein n=1 Tax=Mycena chlorophos TaxID=658473 RepID=A0ABQ0L4W3_MYCCL|nr:predicted protein [Mycena chlorophos]
MSQRIHGGSEGTGEGRGHRAACGRRRMGGTSVGLGRDGVGNQARGDEGSDNIRVRTETGLHRIVFRRNAASPHTNKFYNNVSFAFPSAQAEFDESNSTSTKPPSGNFVQSCVDNTNPPGIVQHVGTVDIQDYDAIRAAMAMSRCTSSPFFSALSSLRSALASADFSSAEPSSALRMFPTHVGRFMLDAVLPHRMPFQDMITGQVKSTPPAPSTPNASRLGAAPALGASTSAAASASSQRAGRVSTQIFGVGVQPKGGSGSGYGLDVAGVAGMVANAASATVSGIVGMMGPSSGGLSLQGSSMKLQCIDQLDKADAPPIPESYIYLLGVQCIISLCEGFAAYTGPVYSTIVIQRPRAADEAVIRAPPALDLTTLPTDDPTTAQLRIVTAIIESGWPALLAALSFIIATNISDELFVEVLASYQVQVDGEWTSIQERAAERETLTGSISPPQASLARMCCFCKPRWRAVQAQHGELTKSRETARTEQWYAPTSVPVVPPSASEQPVLPETVFESVDTADPQTSLRDEDLGLAPAYSHTVPCDQTGAKARPKISPLEELADHQNIFLETLLSHHHHSALLTPCVCGKNKRTVACYDCLQSELLCTQCWLNAHRTLPTHWALVWNSRDEFFERRDFCRVRAASVAIGHNGRQCPNAAPPRSFTLVDCNGIHATAITFCRCPLPGQPLGEPEFQQLLRAGIFPGSIKEPKTGYTLAVLESFRQSRNQGKGSAQNFVKVLERLADPFFASSSLPDIYNNFLVVSRFHSHLDIILRRGHAHDLDSPIPGEADRAYPNRPVGFLGLICGACPEVGVNMPLVFECPHYLRHLIMQNTTLDGNYKANQFHKRDNGSDLCLTDGRMYFPLQAEYERIVDTYVIPPEDKEVPCKAHIGAIRHQGDVKYGNTAVSGVVACACDHAVVGSFIDMKNREAFALGSYAQRELHRHTNSPPPDPTTTTRIPRTGSYDCWCSFVVHKLKRVQTLFPKEEWLHELIKDIEGQIPADHINGHGHDCRVIWQAVYFACRAHFHGETAEMIWAFLNPLGASTRQMTGASRHDTMNYVIDAWNMSKFLRQAQLLADERLDALRLFELHMAVMADLSRQHSEDVPAWSKLSRLPKKSTAGKWESVYQHESTAVLSIDAVLVGMMAEEAQGREDTTQPEASAAKWIHEGIEIERQQRLLIALLASHREHPLDETWNTITRLRDNLNIKLTSFREQQLSIYPRLQLSALDADEPELVAIQLPSWRIKHGQRHAGSQDASDIALRDAEIKLRRSQADNGIMAVRSMSLALSATRKARELDYRGVAGKTRSQRNVQKAELLKDHEIAMYNVAVSAMITLGHITADSKEYPGPLTRRDTRRKETHLHRATGDSRLFDGTAWYAQGTTLSESTLATSVRGPDPDSAEEPRLLAGTQTLKRSGFLKSPRAAKRVKDIIPAESGSDSASDVPDSGSDTEASNTGSPIKSKSPKKKPLKKRKGDGWIWKESGAAGRVLDDEKLAAYKREADRVQWFRAEAEMYRWLEQYERKHAEMFRLITRFARDAAVWKGLADREEEAAGQRNGASCFARMQAAMYGRLEHNAREIFKSTASGAHHDWVKASSFDELVTKIDGWRVEVFRWMDELKIHRAYKDF